MVLQEIDLQCPNNYMHIHLLSLKKSNNHEIYLFLCKNLTSVSFPLKNTIQNYDEIKKKLVTNIANICHLCVCCADWQFNERRQCRSGKLNWQVTK